MAKEKRSVFEIIFEIIGWMQIVASPLIIGGAIGCIVFFNVPGTGGMIIGISLAALGLIIGIIWATRVWKKKGTIHFMSRVMATPDLDGSEKEEEIIKKT